MLINHSKKIAGKLRRIIHAFTSLPGMTTYLWKSVESIMQKSGSKKKGYESRIYGKDGDTASMDILVCPVFEAFKCLKCSEITCVVSEMDLIYSTGYKGIEFSRTKALGFGDECCDYIYTKKY